MIITIIKLYYNFKRESRICYFNDWNIQKSCTNDLCDRILIKITEITSEKRNPGK